MQNKKQGQSLILLLPIVIGLIVALVLVGQTQLLRKKASSTRAVLSLTPAKAEFAINETKSYTLSLTFNTTQANEKLDYFKAILTFPKEYLQVPDGHYVTTSQSGFKTIANVDGPTEANKNGSIAIELGANAPGNGPATAKADGTPNSITIATLDFQGVKQTPSTQEIRIDSSQIVNNTHTPLDTTTQPASFTVGGGQSGQTGLMCQAIKFYDQSFKELSLDDLKRVKSGDTIRFAVAPDAEGATRAHFRLKQGNLGYSAWLETVQKKPGSREFYIEYQLPAGSTNFTLEAEVFDPTTGTWK